MFRGEATCKVVKNAAALLAIVIIPSVVVAGLYFTYARGNTDWKTSDIPLASDYAYQGGIVILASTCTMIAAFVSRWVEPPIKFAATFQAFSMLCMVLSVTCFIVGGELVIFWGVATAIGGAVATLLVDLTRLRRTGITARELNRANNMPGTISYKSHGEHQKPVRTGHATDYAAPDPSTGKKAWGGQDTMHNQLLDDDDGDSDILET